MSEDNFIEKLRKTKYKRDGRFIYFEGNFYGEGASEDNTKYICEALNDYHEKKTNSVNVTVGDIKDFLLLISDFVEANKKATDLSNMNTVKKKRIGKK